MAVFQSEEHIPLREDFSKQSAAIFEDLGTDLQLFPRPRRLIFSTTVDDSGHKYLEWIVCIIIILKTVTDTDKLFKPVNIARLSPING